MQCNWILVGHGTSTGTHGIDERRSHLGHDSAGLCLVQAEDALDHVQLGGGGVKADKRSPTARNQI
jgi:hypothetical protein